MINFSIIGMICGFTLIGVGIVREKTGSIIAGIFFVIFNVWTASRNMNNEDNKDVPQAIDVYRGNTILHIKYKDSVAIDSVVIWK